MAADLITRIILDDTRFNDTLKKVRKGLDMTGSVANGLKSGLKGIAMEIAGAAGAYEIFDTAVKSNAITQEKWNDTLGTAKESVRSFFTSITTGDWSIWNEGVINAIQLSRKYTQAMREMGLAVKIGDVRLSEFEKNLNLFENIAVNTGNSKGEREGAFASFMDEADRAKDYISKLSDFVTEQMNTMLEGKGIKPNKNVRDMLLKYMDPSTEENRLLKEYTDLHDRIQTLTTNIDNMDVRNEAGAKILQQLKDQKKGLEAQMELFNKSQPDVAQAYKLKANFGTEEELDRLLDITGQIIAYQDRIASINNQIRGLSADFSKAGNLKSSGGITPKKVGPAGSLSNVNAQLADAKVQLSLAVDPKSREELFQEIKRLEAEKHEIEFKYKHPDPGFVTPVKGGSLAALAKMPEMKIGGGKKDKAGIIDRKDIKNNNKFAESLMTISNVMSSVTQLTSEGAAAWLTWGGNLLSSIAAAIPAITTLISLKSTEAVVNGVASASQTPIIGWLLAGAAAAAVIGTILSIPKFESGGVVPGSSYSGDKILTRLNSGEMVLNSSQQSRLFNILNNGGSANGGGKVEFEISGKKLVGVINNYNKQRNKIL